MNPAELLQRLVEEQVEFVVIGGFAAVVLGVPHITQDIDLCYNHTPENIIRLQRALAPLHPRLRVEGLTDEEARTLPFQLDKRILHQTTILTLRIDSAPLDLMSSVPGIGNYEQVRKASTVVEMFGLNLQVLDLPALIVSKRTAGRRKDLFLLPQIETVLRLREQKEE